MASRTLTNEENAVEGEDDDEDEDEHVNNEEFEEGLRCIGAPVHDHTGKVIAAVSIAGPAFRVSAERTPQLIRCVLNAAGELSQSLGYCSEPAAIIPDRKLKRRA